MLKKKDTDAEFWPRLTKIKGRYHYITIDWNKWKDEDESEGEEEGPQGGLPPGMDFSQFGGAGGLGGGFPGGLGGGFPGGFGDLGGEEEDDDDGPPELEAEEVTVD